MIEYQIGHLVRAGDGGHMISAHRTEYSCSELMVLAISQRRLIAVTLGATYEHFRVVGANEEVRLEGIIRIAHS